MGLCLECSRISQEASVGGTESSRRKIIRHELREGPPEPDHTGSCGPL